MGPVAMSLTFGMTVMPDPPFSWMLELMQLAEQNGFEHGWTYDSHILWQESYALLPLVADKTERIKLGHCVTNPGIRDPTITASWYATMQDLSGGRMVMGIGRGDSSRRVVGLKPVKVAEFERRLRMIKDLMNGRPVEWNEKELTLEWAKDLPEIPMHVAGYGPKALAVAGRVGDGVIIQLADPQIIQWIMETARAAAREEGRDPDALQCIVCAPSYITDDLAVHMPFPDGTWLTQWRDLDRTCAEFARFSSRDAGARYSNRGGFIVSPKLAVSGLRGRSLRWR